MPPKRKPTSAPKRKPGRPIEPIRPDECASQAGWLLWRWILARGSWVAAAKAASTTGWSLMRLVGRRSDSVTLDEAWRWKELAGIPIEAWGEEPKEDEEDEDK